METAQTCGEIETHAVFRFSLHKDYERMIFLDAFVSSQDTFHFFHTAFSSVLITQQSFIFDIIIINLCDCVVSYSSFDVRPDVSVRVCVSGRIKKLCDTVCIDFDRKLITAKEMEFVRVQTAGTAFLAPAQFSAYSVRFDGGLWP